WNKPRRNFPIRTKTAMIIARTRTSTPPSARVARGVPMS
ncbi:MAG: hypothetical protein AVDCRST_MAG88-2373, partial [uncultured Thermomicrobiales bacterium]